jgi:hypothetical protein
MAGVPPVASRRCRVLLALALGAGLVPLTAAPAAADPPAPTDYRSEVTSVEPAADGLEVTVVGGDGFLQVDVAQGHTLAVPGYSGEPYIRVRDDDTVQENDRSAATYLNESRDRTDVERTYDPADPPRWRTVATDGRWAWHDHRIHHMGRGERPGARSEDGIAWEVPMALDGEELVVAGRYRLLDGPSPVPWLLGAVVLAGAVVALSRFLAPITAAGATLVLVGVGSVIAGVAQRGASPPGAPTPPLVVILPALALVAGVTVVVQRGRVLRAVAALAGAAAAAGWALVRLSVLWRRELPTSLPEAFDRFVTAAALGGAVAVAAVVVASGALTPPPPGEAAADSDRPGPS